MFGSNCNTASVPLVANIDGNGNNNGWGAEGSWLWFIIVIFAIFGWGGFGNGFGGNGMNGGVGSEACEVVLQYLFQSLTATHQGDEHKHAPEHAEAREQTAALVPRDGIENLFICI